MSRGIRTAVAATVLALAVCAPVGAQDAKAQAPDLDPAFRADIEKMLEVTGANTMAGQIATVLSNQMIDSLRRQQPQTPQRAGDIIKEVLNAEFAHMFDAPDGIRGEVVQIYASHFTHAEIRALLNFYATDLGQKAIALGPQLAQQSAAAGQKWASVNAPRVLEVVQQRLRAEGLVK